MYDSAYNDVDFTTSIVFNRLFNIPLKYIVVPTAKQQGSIDCGIFAIAYATAIALSASRPEISSINFDQKNLRSHLCKCLEAKT